MHASNYIIRLSISSFFCVFSYITVGKRCRLNIDTQRKLENEFLVCHIILSMCGIVHEDKFQAVQEDHTSRQFSQIRYLTGREMHWGYKLPT